MNFWQSRAGGWIVLAALVVMWGSAYAAMNIAVKEVPPLWVAALRLWVSAVFVFILMVLRGEAMPSPYAAPGAWRSYTWVGLIGTAVPFSLFAWGAGQAPSSLMGISNGASPVFTGILAALFVTSEVMSLRRWLGLGVGFIGLVVLVLPDALAALRGVEASANIVFGVLAGFAAAFGFATANIMTRQAPATSVYVATLIFSLTAALACTFAAIFSSPWPQNVSGVAWLNIALLGFFPTALAGLLYVWSVRTHGPVFVSLATYIVPLWATGLGVVALGETISLNAVAALGLIFAGVFVASRR
jgi:drug/metabolite transporter (DMT)-like permease